MSARPDSSLISGPLLLLSLQFRFLLLLGLLKFLFVLAFGNVLLPLHRDPPARAAKGRLTMPTCMRLYSSGNSPSINVTFTAV